MVFSSTIFLFIFLPFVLAINFLLKKQYRNVFLLLASLLFYAWGEGLLVLLMLFSISLNYISGIGIELFLTKDKKYSKIVLGFAVAGNLALLFYYKYANFIVETLQEIGFYTSYEHTDILLPIGISFFTFQGISYLVDVYRGEVEVQRNLLHLGLYISFFPQLIAGPIVRYHDIDQQIKKRKINATLFSEGVIRFIRGLAKKVLIANNAAFFADEVFSVSPLDLSIGSAWLGIICYTIQIYFDFSGYSDMAIGLGKMMGFSFKENFNYPYIANSIQDFWRRWHISLSTWFRDYLYIPLGGSRNGQLMTYRNLFIVFFVTGLWHGASWNFIFWGLFHGFFLILERAKIFNTSLWPSILRHLYVLLVVVLGWVFFRALTMTDAFNYIGSLIGLNNGQNNIAFVYLNNYTLTMLMLALVFSTPIRAKITSLKFFSINRLLQGAHIILRYSFYLVIFLLSVIELAQSNYNPFIYFRF